MNITGVIMTRPGIGSTKIAYGASGAFIDRPASDTYSTFVNLISGSSEATSGINFDASRSWTGKKRRKF